MDPPSTSPIGLAAFSVSPAAGKPYVALYTPESKGGPASVQMQDYSKFLPADAKGENPQPVCHKSFFRCSSIKIMWSSLGTAVLALAASDVDKTNKSYYGESALMYLSSDGTWNCF